MSKLECTQSCVCSTSPEVSLHVAAEVWPCGRKFRREDEQVYSVPPMVRSDSYLLVCREMALITNVWMGFISTTDTSVLAKGYNRLAVLKYFSK